MRGLVRGIRGVVAYIGDVAACDYYSTSCVWERKNYQAKQLRNNWQIERR